MIKDSMFNLIIRGITIVSRFVLTFYIAKYMSPEDLGVYGIFTVTITLSVLVVGFDYYMFCNREILKSKFDAIFLIRDELVFFFVMYAFTFPLFTLIFYLEIISWEYLVWFYMLLVLEHLSQEIFRLLVIISKPIAANLVSFIRSGAWIYILIIIFIFYKDLNQLNLIFLMWTIGAFLSIVVGIYFLREFNWKLLNKKPVNWLFIKSGFKSSIPFFIATLALKGIEFSDRYFLKYFYGDAEVGVYTFFMQIVSVMQVIVYTGIVSIVYPKALYAYQDNNITDYIEYKRKMNKWVIITILACVAFIPVILLIVLKLVNNQIYNQNITVFWLTLIGLAINTLGLIPHYKLYIHREEKKILISTSMCLFVGIGVNYLLIPIYGLVGASLSLIIVMSLFTSLKFWFASKIKLNLKF